MPSEAEIRCQSFSVRLLDGQPWFMVFGGANACLVKNQLDVQHYAINDLKVDADTVRNEFRTALEDIAVQDTYNRTTVLELNQPLAVAFILATPYITTEHLVRSTTQQSYAPYLTEIPGVELPGVGVVTVRIASVGRETSRMYGWLYGSDGEARVGEYYMHLFD